MNEAEPSPINLDELRMLPDWLREDAPAPSKQYAGHDYPLGGDSPDRRGGRSGGFGGRNDRRDSRGGAPPDRRGDSGRSGPPPRRGDDRGPRDERRPGPGPRPEPPVPAPVRVEFVPDDRCLASINKQIRTTHLAYPLFGLARMFLQEPERHFVQFSVAPDAPAGTLLYQLGEEGPVTLERATLEKMAFDALREQFYVEETVQKEPLKGNFTNVARERISGVLLGPTNYHAYQPALRSLYDTRYSRRMSFEDFRRNVEVSTDPALIERWKEESRTTTTTSTRVAEGETPVVLGSPMDVRAHFRQHHLDALVRGGTSFKVHGSVARTLPEPALMQVIREAHEREMRYPAQFVQLLRQGLQNAGLHIFKHRKRIVYVSLARPTPFVAHGAVSPNVSAILETIAESPLCTRKLLAERVLARNSDNAPALMVKPAEETLTLREATPVPDTQPAVVGDELASPPSAETALADSSDSVLAPAGAAVRPPGADAASRLPDDPAARAKAALAADLRFLVQSGHIIEFHNGTFDLPLPPKPKEENSPAFVGSAKPVSGQRQDSVGNTARAERPRPSAPPTSSGEEVTVFAASGAGVEAAPDEGIEEETRSMLDVIEPAPTAPTLAADFSPPEPPQPTEKSLSVEPAKTVETMPGAVFHDKTDEDGRISGPAAAPVDLPIPGDSEDPPDSRP